MNRLDLALWGRDHWELFARISKATRDESGFLKTTDVILDRKSLRVNPNRHPELYCRGNWRLPTGWRRGDPYPSPTTLRGRKSVSGHDDFDVLDDMEHIGWLEVINKTKVHLRVTWLGVSATKAFLSYLATGSRAKDFEFHPDLLKEIENARPEPEPAERPPDSDPS